MLPKVMVVSGRKYDVTGRIKVDDFKPSLGHGIAHLVQQLSYVLDNRNVLIQFPAVGKEFSLL